MNAKESTIIPSSRPCTLRKIRTPRPSGAASCTTNTPKPQRCNALQTLHYAIAGTLRTSSSAIADMSAMPPLETTSLRQQVPEALQSRELALQVEIRQQAETERKLVQTIEASKKEEDEIQQQVDALAKQLRDKSVKLWKAQKKHREKEEELRELRRKREEVEETEARRLSGILAQLVCLNTYIWKRFADFIKKQPDDSPQSPALQLYRSTLPEQPNDAPKKETQEVVKARGKRRTTDSYEGRKRRRTTASDSLFPDHGTDTSSTDPVVRHLYTVR